jgi:hypothetical protein
MRRPRPRGVRLSVEHLEDRHLPSAYSAATVSDLIADIKAANQTGGANTITLKEATGYLLTTIDNTKDGPTGLPVITGGMKPDNLTIVGNDDFIQRGMASFRFFDVAAGASLTLENLTLLGGLLTGGSGVGAEGGAIFNQGTLVLSGATVQSNGIMAAAGADGKSPKGGQPGSDARGGGIWSDGTLTLENGSVIENNYVVAGNGGIASGSALGGDGGNAFGGGVYVAGGTASIGSSTVSGNTAQGGIGGASGSYYGFGGDARGAGICVAGGSVCLSSDTVAYNSATGGTGAATGDPPTGCAMGGGICVAGGSVSLSGDTVEHNSATAIGSNPFFQYGQGGGIYIASGTTVTLYSDTVEYNNASATFPEPTSAGGGIYVMVGNASVYIDAATVVYNNSDSHTGLNGSTANIFN